MESIGGVAGNTLRKNKLGTVYYLRAAGSIPAQCIGWHIYFASVVGRTCKNSSLWKLGVLGTPVHIRLLPQNV